VKEAPVFPLLKEIRKEALELLPFALREVKQVPSVRSRPE